MTHIDYKLKIVAIMCFAFIAISSFIAHANPAKGYELSIYESTPFIVWILLIISIAGGVTIIIHQAYTKGYKNSNFWLIGFLILILARVSLFCVPCIRGYYAWRGDSISHVGMLADILFTGHFSNENFYPVIHTLPSEIIALTGISYLAGWNLINVTFYIMYIFSIYLLATVIVPKREQQLLTVALAAAVNPLGVWPSMSILLLPLLFFFYYKRSTSAYSILFVIFIILYPFLHVLSSLMVIVILCLIESSKIVFHFINRKNRIGPVPHPKLSLTAILIELTILIPWTLSFYMFHTSLRLLWHQIQTGAGPDVLGGMGSTLNKIDVHGFDFVELLFKMYGVNIILLILSLIAAFIVIKQIRSGSIKKETQNLFSLLIVFLFMDLLYFLYLLGAPGLQPIQPDRIMSFIMVFTPIFAGFSLYELSNSVRFKHLMSGGIICIILLASCLSIFSFYASPYIILPNNQITQMDMAGMKWYIQEKDSTIGSVDIMTPPGRFAMGILGSIEARKRADLDYGRYGSEKIPDHFDYIHRSSLGELYTKDRYAVITKFDRIIYTTVWKVVGRFNDSDFEKLERDATVGKLYSNSELDVYFIHTTSIS